MPPQLVPTRFRYAVKSLGKALDPTCPSSDVRKLGSARARPIGELARSRRRLNACLPSALRRRSSALLAGAQHISGSWPLTDRYMRAVPRPAQLPADHQLDLPLWMVQPLQERNIVDIGLPSAYSER